MIDNYTENVDIKTVLVEYEDGGMKFWVNGQYERLEDPSYVEARHKQQQKAQAEFLKELQRMIDEGE